MLNLWAGRLYRLSIHLSMKKFVVLLGLLPVVAEGWSQADQRPAAAPVPAIEEKRLSASEYAKLADSQQEALQEAQGAAAAWLNLYKAELYSNYTAHSRTVSGASRSKLEEIANNADRYVPDSFEAAYIRYLHGNKSPQALDALSRANAMRPGEQELWDDMLMLAEISGDQTRVKQFAAQLNGSGLYSPAEMEYNRNVLASVPPGALLVTYGHVDTYPLLIQQHLYGFRPDVKIVCLDWFGAETYRARVAAWCGMPAAGLSAAVSGSLEKMADAGAPLCMALTLPPAELKKYAAQLYLEGLVFRHSKKPIDNVPGLVNNWEVQFAKKHVTTAEPLNRNYILPLAQLVQYYEGAGQQVDAKGVKEMLRQVARHAKCEAELSNYLD